MTYFLFIIAIIIGIVFLVISVKEFKNFCFRKELLQLDPELGYNHELEILNDGYYCLTLVHAYQILKIRNFEIKIIPINSNNTIKINIPRGKVCFPYKWKILSAEYCTFFLKKGSYNIVLENIEDLHVILPFSLLSLYFNKKMKIKRRTFVIQSTEVGLKKYVSFFYYTLGVLTLYFSIYFMTGGFGELPMMRQ